MVVPTDYYVKKSANEDLNPEETLADVLSRHAAIEKPIGHGVFRAVYVFILLISVFIFFKSLQLQLVEGERLAGIAQRRNLSQYSMPALRGVIYDQSGASLVENVPIFDLIAVHSELPGSSREREQVIDSLWPIIKTDRAGLAGNFETHRNSAAFLIKKGLSKEEIARIKASALKGIYVAANFQRHYPEADAFSSILGYTAKVGPGDIESDPYYLPTDRIGRLGVEAYYEEELRGDHRRLFLKSDLVSAPADKSRPGHDLILSIDKLIQRKLYRIMADTLNSAGLKRGAAVIQDVRTGAVLGLVSLPSFDANVFENYYEEANAQKISRILQNKDKPLFNRVVAGRYSPGSTIKPLLALAGLKEAVITPETTIFANGSISVTSKYDPNVIYTFKDWRVHGLTDLKKAIADSVDIYFYALGGGYGNIRGLGIDRITGYLREFLADKILGIDLPGEVSGLVPSPEWKQAVKGSQWFVGDTYNISIGQGDLGVTPLWLNTYIGSLANGGELMKPYLVKEVKNFEGRVINEVKPQVLAKIPFNPETIEIIKESMRQAVTSGTAVMLNNLSVKVAAKTGTAQTSGQNLNSLFTVFGPYADPEISMTVLIENVQGQSLAIKVAHDFLLWYFAELSVSERSDANR